MARITLSAHWKFHRLARAVGSAVLARGILEVLWEPCWLAGDPYVGTSADIEALCEWRGKSGALTEALLAAVPSHAGFIEPFPAAHGHYQLHDFADHGPPPAPPTTRPRPARRVVRCSHCHREFLAANPTARTCSARCRQAVCTAARRVRNEEAQAPQSPADPGMATRQEALQ